jgi:endonuclease/exonuclease/phosphatase family metal-dependent hydrolase
MDDQDGRTWGVLVWNIGRGANPRCRAQEVWSYLDDLTSRYGIEVAILNEADVSTLKSKNAAAVREARAEPAVFSERGTIGRDSWTNGGLRNAKDRRGWTAAIVAETGAQPIGQSDVRARAPVWPHRRPDLPFSASRPGTWVAARVAAGGLDVSCVSLYGLAEELSDASMHTSLSEVSPLFSDPGYMDLVLLGGDFNVSTAFAEASAREQSRIVLARIAAYGLKDVLREWRKNFGVPRLANCTCGDDPCLHLMTRLTPNGNGINRPWQERVSPQVDYLFVSEVLFTRFVKIVQLSPDEWERYSDHSPILAMFQSE